MPNSAQIRKLLTIKTMRKKLAELDVARANAEVSNAKTAVDQAERNERDILQSGAERREERISDLLKHPANTAVQDTMIVNVFARTDHEKLEARANVLQKYTDLAASRQKAIEKQEKLARFLQVEERARQFCERLETSENLKAQRSE